MDKFLANLYREEMEKAAAADFQSFLDDQPVSELENMLGLKKQAVAGAPEAPLPNDSLGHTLDAKMKLLDAYVAKTRGEPVPTREQSKAVGHSNAETEKKAAMVWADRMGRRLAKLASQPPVEGATVDPESWSQSRQGMMEALSEPDAVADRVQRARRGGLMGVPIGGALGAGAGALLGKHVGASPGQGALLGALLGMPLGVMGGIGSGAGRSNEDQLAQRGIQMTMGGLGRGRFTPEAAAKYLKKKESEGVGDGAGRGLAGEGASTGITSLGGLGDTGVGQEMSTTASVKAKIAARALRATRGAPDHIKKTAAVLAGRQIAKLAARQ